MTLRTTLGRALFNEALPENYPYVNHEVTKKELGQVINDLAERYRKIDVAATLDALKAAGFYWATRSGVTVAAEDVVIPKAKQEPRDRHLVEDGFVASRKRRPNTPSVGGRAPVLRVPLRKQFPHAICAGRNQVRVRIDANGIMHVAAKDKTRADGYARQGGSGREEVVQEVDAGTGDRPAQDGLLG